MVNSCLREDRVCCRSVVLDVVRTMLSTKSNRYTVYDPHRKMNSEVSNLASINPKEKR
jgi:hypothetical protein